MKEELKNLITISLSVVLILVVTYFTTAFFLTGELGEEKTNSDVVSNDSSQDISTEYDNMIIASKTFLQNEENYKVIFISSKEVTDDIKNSINLYSNEDVKLYVVNTDEAINKFVVSDIENPNAINYSELKIKGTTLIEIKNGAISNYYSDSSEIVKNLK